MSLHIRPASRRVTRSASGSAVTGERHLAALQQSTEFQDCVAATLDRLSGVGITGCWMVNRVVDDTYTVLASDGTYPEVVDGISVPWPQAVCSMILHHQVAGIECDLLTSTVPGVAEQAAAWGIRGYVGVRLSDDNGQLLGTMCAYSREPLSEQAAAHAGLVARGLGELIGVRLDQTLTAVRQGREEDLEAAMSSRDPLTGLPDRRGWGLLLDREDNRGRTIADPSGVVLVDIGPVRTARALRRVTAAVSEAAGDGVVVSRVGGRQLGLLCAGQASTQVSETANQVTAQLNEGGMAAVTTFAMRGGINTLLDTWWRAEGQLLAARSATEAA